MWNLLCLKKCVAKPESSINCWWENYLIFRKHQHNLHLHHFQSFKGILAHQGHISKVSANDESLTDEHNFNVNVYY